MSSNRGLVSKHATCRFRGRFAQGVNLRVSRSEVVHTARVWYVKLPAGRGGGNPVRNSGALSGPRGSHEKAEVRAERDTRQDRPSPPSRSGITTPQG